MSVRFHREFRISEQRTGNASEKLPRKLLDMRARKWNKTVRLQEVEHTLTIQVGHYADVVPVVEAVSKMDAAVEIVLVIRRQSREHTELYPGGVTILRHRADDLDRTFGVPPLVVGFDYFSEGALTKQPQYCICNSC